MSANTPHEVDVAQGWLVEALTALDECHGPCRMGTCTKSMSDPYGCGGCCACLGGCAATGGADPTLTVTDPFDAVNNETYFGLVYEWGTDQVTATAVSFMARRATWELQRSAVWG